MTFAALLPLIFNLLGKILTIATTPEGLAWVGRWLKDLQPELDRKIANMTDFPDPKEKP